MADPWLHHPNYSVSGPSSTPAPPTPGQATPVTPSSNISTPRSSADNFESHHGDRPSPNRPSDAFDYTTIHTYEISPPTSPSIDHFPPALRARGAHFTDHSTPVARSDSLSSFLPRSLTPGAPRDRELHTRPGSRPVSQILPVRGLSIPPALLPAVSPAYQIPAAPAPPPLPTDMSYSHGSVNAESQSPSPWAASGTSTSSPKHSHTGSFLADKVLGSFRSQKSYQQLSSGDRDLGIVLEDLPEGDRSNPPALPRPGKRGYHSAKGVDSDDDEHGTIGFDISSFGGGPIESQRSLSPTELRDENERNLRREQGNYAAEFHQLEKLEAQGITNGLGGGMFGSRTDITPQPDGSLAQHSSKPSVDVNTVRSRVGLTRGKSIRDIAQREAKQRQQMVVVNEYVGVDLSALGGSARDFGAGDGGRAGDGTSNQSFYFPEGKIWPNPALSSFNPNISVDPEMPNWRPISMRWPYISPLILLAIALAALQEVLFRLSDTRSRQDPKEGLLRFKSPRELNIWQYFCWKYLPTIAAVTYGVMWQVVDFEVKRLEPYYQLSKPTGALAEESLSIDYLTFWHYLTPFKAIKYRHWAVVYCSVATLLASSIAPTLLSASIILTPAQRLRKSYEYKFVGIHHIWSRFLSGAFLAVAVLGLLLLWQLRRKSGLLSDPKGIAGIAAMANKSHILMDFQGLDIEREAKIHKRLRNRRYVLHKSSLWQGEYVRNKDQRSERRKVQNPHPLMLRKKAGIPYIMSIAAFMGVIPVLVFNTKANTVTEKAPWLLTAGAVVIKLMWNTLECGIRMMEPFYILSRRHAPSKTLTLDYTGTIPGVMPIVALRNGHFLVALVGFNAVLAEVLTVCVSSFGVKGSDFLNIDAGQPDGEETFRSFWVSLSLALAILLSMAISACIVYYHRGSAFLPREPGTIASVLAFIHQSKMLWDFVDTEKMNAKQMTIHLEELGKKYGFGWFKGRDKKRHCGVDEEELTQSYTLGIDLNDALNPWENLDHL